LVGNRKLWVYRMPNLAIVGEGVDTGASPSFKIVLGLPRTVLSTPSISFRTFVHVVVGKI